MIFMVLFQRFCVNLQMVAIGRQYKSFATSKLLFRQQHCESYQQTSVRACTADLWLHVADKAPQSAVIETEIPNVPPDKRIGSALQPNRLIQSVSVLPVSKARGPDAVERFTYIPALKVAALATRSHQEWRIRRRFSIKRGTPPPQLITPRKMPGKNSWKG